MTSQTGRIWLDRNIGAARVATSSPNQESHGYYFQWGRPADGHQFAYSEPTSKQATTIFPSSNEFIIVDNTTTDWVEDGADTDGIQRRLFLSVVDGKGICPQGYRVPTAAEWKSELKYAPNMRQSVLKLPLAGFRNGENGEIEKAESTINSFMQDVAGYYLASDNSSQKQAKFLFLAQDGKGRIETKGRAYGYSVRCIKAHTNERGKVSDVNIAVSERNSTETETETDTDKGTGTDTDTDTGTGADTGTEAGTDTDTDTGTGADGSSFDDYGNTISTATSINPNSTISGSIEVVGDNDYFKIVVPTAGTLTVYTSGQTDTEGFLYNAKNHRVASNDDSNTSDHNFKISKFIAAGTYYVRVRHHDKLLVGSYEFVSHFIPDDHSSTLGDARPISPNSTTSGSIEIPGDVDWFKIVIPSGGGILTVSTTGSTDTNGSLYNASGREVASDDNNGSDHNFKITQTVTAGIYYVRVSASSLTGRYELVSQFDDHGSDRSTAARIDLNSTTSGSLEVAGDVDWFKIVIPSGGGILTVSTTGSTDTIGELLDASGNEIARNDNNGTDNNFKILRGVAAGTYYVKVKHHSTSSIGSYALVSHFVPDQGNTANTAALINPNSTAIGSIEVAGDKDWFKIVVPTAGTLVINTTGSTDTEGFLYDDTNGTPLVYDDNNGTDNNFRISRFITAGTYYVEVKHHRSVSTGHYTLVSHFIPDHPDTRDTAVLIDPPNSTTSGSIEVAGDEDWFKIVIPTAGTLTVYTTGSTDTEGFLYDANGTQLTFSDDMRSSDHNFGISKPLTAGTYYVKVKHHSSTEIGSYLLITSFAAGEISQAQVLDDHGNSKNTATPIDLNGTTSGNIEAFGDIDYFKIVIPRGSVGRLTVYTTGSGDTKGELLDANGTQLVSDDNGGTENNFRISQIVTAGTYYIKVKYYFASETGSYLLVTGFTPQAEVSSDHGDSRDTATPIDLNSTTSGSIDRAGDNDWFKIVIPTTGTLTVYTTGSGDTAGYLYDTNGTQLVYNDDVNGTNKNFRISQIVTAGTYYVRVKNFSGQAAGNDYTLISRFTPRRDDYGNSRTTATSINPNSTTQGHLETAGDVDWFKIVIPSGGGTLTVRATNTVSITQAFRAGTYYVEVSASSAGSSGEIYYLGGTFHVKVSVSSTDSYTLTSQFT
ncbi:MAG: pre-peptidase C-terminal domain-containing protein, partial [Sulfurovum sp.]|nr:pre-peptidase C-terminal domain-containing protein [Sulfurovum sp.]